MGTAGSALLLGPALPPQPVGGPHTRGPGAARSWLKERLLPERMGVSHLATAPDQELEEGRDICRPGVGNWDRLGLGQDRSPHG